MDDDALRSVHSQLIGRMCSFLTQIGIDTREQKLPEPTFLPGLLISRGVLLIDPERVLCPGDILHEAGHIAVSEPASRVQLAGNVVAQQPEKAGEELAVLLWSYAACLHLNINLRVVFHPDGYRDQSEWLIEQFTQGNYIGLPLLVWMGLTQPPAPDRIAGGFPAMTRWLRV